MPFIYASTFDLITLHIVLSQVVRSLAGWLVFPLPLVTAPIPALRLLRFTYGSRSHYFLCLASARFTTANGIMQINLLRGRPTRETATNNPRVTVYMARSSRSSRWASQPATWASVGWDKDKGRNKVCSTSNGQFPCLEIICDDHFYYIIIPPPHHIQLHSSSSNNNKIINPILVYRVGQWIQESGFVGAVFSPF